VVAHHKAGGPFLDDDTKMTLSIRPRRYGLIQIKEPHHRNVLFSIILRGRILLEPNFKAAELAAFLFCKIGTILPTCSA
jgi:hypothetical protein